MGPYQLSNYLATPCPFSVPMPSLMYFAFLATVVMLFIGCVWVNDTGGDIFKKNF